MQKSSDVKKKNVFRSDLGMDDYKGVTKNLTLLNTSGKVTKVVGFRLKNLSEYYFFLVSICVIVFIYAVSESCVILRILLTIS